MTTSSSLKNTSLRAANQRTKYHFLTIVTNEELAYKRQNQTDLLICAALFL